jgi:hypothetical protein
MSTLKTRPIGKLRQDVQGRPPRCKTKARELFLSFLGRQQWLGPKPSRSIFAKPNQVGATDSSQRMTDFTEARNMGLAAGDVDKYRSGV